MVVGGVQLAFVRVHVLRKSVHRNDHSLDGKASVLSREECRFVVARPPFFSDQLLEFAVE